LKTVEKVEIEVFDRPVKVYNFEVEDWHTYYVTEQGVLVHNAKNYDGNGNTGVGNKGTSKTEIIGKPHASAQHQAFTMDEVNKLSSTGEFSKIYINKSLKTAGFNGTQKPDIIAVGKNGNGHIIEIASPSQLSGKRMLDLTDKFNTMLENNPGMTGDLIFPKY